MRATGEASRAPRTAVAQVARCIEHQQALRLWGGCKRSLAPVGAVSAANELAGGPIRG